MILNNFDVDPSYFADKYGMPVGDRREMVPVMPPEGDGADGDGILGRRIRASKRTADLFRLSPTDYVGAA